MARGPQAVVAACSLATTALADGALDPSGTSGSREDWADAVGSLQRVIDVASAAQDAAIARLAAIEPEEGEDGTVVESHRALGHVALDAPAIVSGVLSVSAVHAERRVRSAVRLAADGPAGTASATGLRGVHAAMGAGRLDAYRAGVVAEELEEAPAEVRATVVAALDPHLATEDAAHLRRRCRRALARISPDLLRQRAQRARAESGLRRWVDEPGVDRWEGTFPSEEAAQAWGAIDALARRYVAQAACSTLERARAKALTDLVAGNATVETVVTVTVPAAALSGPSPRSAGTGRGTGTGGAAGGDRDSTADGLGVDEPALVEVAGVGSGQPVLVSRAWLTSTLGAPRTSPARFGATVRVASCHPVSGALLDPVTDHDPGTDTHAATAAGVGQGDRAAGDAPVARTDVVGTDRYRPSRRLVTLVRARDRRCRFPGCTVAAVFCDLDHVRPWPQGPTSADNLLCLCRRHHRIKQRPGWAVVLTHDAVATWTDPTGRIRTSLPVDALRVTVLSGAGADGVAVHPSAADATVPVHDGPDIASRRRTLVPDGPHSHLEFVLEHRAAGLSVPRTTWHDLRGRPGRQGRHRPDVAPPRGDLVLGAHDHWHLRGPRARRSAGTDPPPF